MIKEMIVSSTALETKVAILEDDQLAELYIERNRSRGILGNIYTGRVTKVLPGMQSAFVNIGLEKDAFLYVSDFIEDNEEYDKVLTDAEEQVATVLAEAEVQERPRSGTARQEKPRWKERREREGYRQPAASPSAAEAAPPAELFNLSAETDRLAGIALAAPELAEPSADPRACRAGAARGSCPRGRCCGTGGRRNCRRPAALRRRVTPAGQAELTRVKERIDPGRRRCCPLLRARSRRRLAGRSPSGPCRAAQTVHGRAPHPQHRAPIHRRHAAGKGRRSSSRSPRSRSERKGPASPATWRFPGDTWSTCRRWTTSAFPARSVPRPRESG